MSTKLINYVTSSKAKQEENLIFQRLCTLKDGTPVNQLFSFDIRAVAVKEVLEIDLQVMVQAEVTSAYSQLKVPCIVEHAGIIFLEYKDRSYPGGLTKPMWNALGSKFVAETGSSGRRAIARAVVAYCDGKAVSTFVGETAGTIADAPRGTRDFYWDTIFIPDDPSGRAANKTYAEIVADPALGLEYKVTQLSQSTKAMLALLEHLRTKSSNFWP